MKSKTCIAAMAVFIIFRWGPAQRGLFSQTPWFENVQKDPSQIASSKLFLYKIHTMPTDSSDSVRLTFSAKIVYDLLQFIHKDTAYIAGYELTLAINNARGESVPGKIKKRELSVKKYAETNSRSRFSREKINFILPPGDYNLFIELLDTVTKQPLRRNEKLMLMDFFSKPFTATEILFYSLSENEDVVREDDYPVFPPVFPLSSDSIRARLYVCTEDLPKQLKIERTIFGSNDRLVRSDTLAITLNSRIQPITLSLPERLEFGQYSLSVSLSDGTSQANLKSPFYIRWKSHTTMIPNLEQAVETIQYVMDKNEWNHLMKQPRDMQEKLLDKFWTDRDPDPSTAENELEEEYYRRVSFANQYFSSWNKGMDGWQADRGKIYIICGPPSEVESPSAPAGQKSQYEIWYYRNLQKRFVFLDRYGNGDYRLISEE